VPRISYVRGIAIYMYWDEGSHATPRFHAHHAGSRASVDLDGRIAAGDLEGAALGYVQECDKRTGTNCGRIGNELVEPMLPFEPLP
jgi:hypothetical protein